MKYIFNSRMPGDKRGEDHTVGLLAAPLFSVMSTFGVIVLKLQMKTVAKISYIPFVLLILFASPINIPAQYL